MLIIFSNIIVTFVLGIGALHKKIIANIMVKKIFYDTPKNHILAKMYSMNWKLPFFMQIVKKFCPNFKSTYLIEFLYPREIKNVCYIKNLNVLEYIKKIEVGQLLLFKMKLPTSSKNSKFQKKFFQPRMKYTYLDEFLSPLLAKKCI